MQLFSMLFALEWSLGNGQILNLNLNTSFCKIEILGTVEDTESSMKDETKVEEKQTFVESQPATNNFPSLSSEEDGYYMGTPPTMSLESEIQPCAIDIDTLNSEPTSLTNVSENISSDIKSVSSENSSDYKVITDPQSLEKNSLLKATDILSADSGTDDQMSSGTFSQDEISPRYADLPTSLNMEKRRTQSSSDAPRINTETYQDLTRRSSVKDRTLSMETRSTSIASDASEQEIPPTTPRSDPTVSPGSDQNKFVYGDNSNEKSSTDIMTQSIYVGSDDSEISSESHLSTMQTTQQTISSSEESKVTTMVTEESSVFESVIKMSENVTENILEETKTITKSTKMAVEESIVLQEDSSDDTKEKLLKSKEVSGDQKTQSITVVSTESSVMVTRTDTRSYSDVLKSDKNSDSKQTVTTSSGMDNKSSVATEAVTEVLKTESVLQLMGSSTPSTSQESGEDRPKKLSYSEVVKSDSKDGKDKEDPIADWGKPLGLPSPIRPSTPAKQPKKNDDESQDSNKVC